MEAILILILGVFSISFVLNFVNNEIQAEVEVSEFTLLYKINLEDKDVTKGLSLYYTISYFVCFSFSAFIFILFISFQPPRELTYFALPVIGFGIMDLRLCIIEFLWGITNIGGRGFRPFKLLEPKRIAKKRLIVVFLSVVFVFLIAILLRVSQFKLF